MKKTGHHLPLLLPLFLLLFTAPEASGQIFKKLAKKAEKAAERTVERRVEKETTEKTDQALDSILEPGSKGKNEKGNPSNTGSSTTPNEETTNSGGQNPGQNSHESGSNNITVYSKFDFVPGDKLLFFDDYANDFIGDFPSKWNTNGSGEVVTVNNSPQRWMELVPGWGTYYIPDVPTLPKDYTIEFDLLTAGLDKKTSSTAGLTVLVSDDTKFKVGSHNANIWIPFGQYGAFDIRVKNYAYKAGNEINNTIRADIRNAIINKPHISIAVNDKRFRLWINEKKYVDIPRFIPQGNPLTTLKFNVNNLRDGIDRVFISNLKVAEGGVDLRRKLISDGKVSTNGILFDSGSANIQPRSMGIIRQISQVLQQESGMTLKIVGHTDADGNEDVNMKLSEDRAASVKNALIQVYNISGNRLQTAGKGEKEPVGDNSTIAGKAQNRRVEFIKI
ncbi:MAG: OmpA family protein [Bacteroidota bacterium]